MSDFKIELSDPARDDIQDISQYTQTRYGAKQADAYDHVVRSALDSIREDPFRPGSRDRSKDLKQPGLRSYHTSLSNDPAESHVKSPRHLILYFEPKDDVVVINRIVHESRDIDRHLSPEQDQRQVYKAKTPTKDQGRER